MRVGASWGPTCDANDPRLATGDQRLPAAAGATLRYRQGRKGTRGPHTYLPTLLTAIHHNQYTEYCYSHAPRLCHRRSPNNHTKQTVLVTQGHGKHGGFRPQPAFTKPARGVAAIHGCDEPGSPRRRAAAPTVTMECAGSSFVVWPLTLPSPPHPPPLRFWSLPATRAD